MSIDFLKKLENELKREKATAERTEALVRIGIKLKAYEGDDKIVSSEELSEMIDSEPEPFRIMSKINKLDAIVDGFRGGQLIILAAAKKSGKTTFSMQLTESMREHNPCWFPFEQGGEELVRQFKDKKMKIPFFYLPAKNDKKDQKWIEERMLEAIVKFDTKIFFIDNFDWIDKPRNNDRFDIAVGDVLMWIKAFAIKWNVTILLMAHITKLEDDVPPTSNDIRDSSRFGQMADLVLILWRKVRKEKVEGTNSKVLIKTNKTLLNVAENRRNGKTGYVQLNFKDDRYTEEQWDEALESNQHETDF